MKKQFLLSFLALSLLTGCQKELFTAAVKPCIETVPTNVNHPMKDGIQTIINKYVSLGIPGIQVAVKNKDGLYITQGGWANIAEKTPLQPCMTGWLFSITKLYTASLIMKQREKGLIDLDEKIQHYLPNNVSTKLNGSDKVTVRMLLNHTSGLTNFTELPAYQVAILNNPLKGPGINDILQLLYGKPLVFEPGTDFTYCNTNYMLLQLILENITHLPYEQLLKTEIIQPLHLTRTYYNLQDEATKSLNFPSYYFDRHANKQLEEVTRWNQALANACQGWGGIAATPSDVLTFYEALVTGQVVNAASLKEMKTWIQGKASTQPDYGAGIEYLQYAGNATPQFGHEGDGIGSTTMIMYVPDNDTYVYMQCTVGRKIYTPYLFTTTDFKNELCKYMANWK